VGLPFRLAGEPIKCTRPDIFCMCDSSRFELHTILEIRITRKRGPEKRKVTGD
jgi:hypothetical protein